MTNTVTNNDFSNDSGAAIKNTVDRVIEGSGRVATEVKGTVRDLGRGIKDSGNAVMKDIDVKAHEAYDQLYDAGKKGSERVVSEIRRAPLSSALIAFGVGTALGLLLRR